MVITRNRKWLVASILVTASAFMLAACATLERIPQAFVLLYAAAVALDAVLFFLGYREQKQADAQIQRANS